MKLRFLPQAWQTARVGQAGWDRPVQTGPFSQALAERRVALVIGNDAYQQVAPLRKAANDARAVSTVLRDLGFSVNESLNATRRDMNFAIQKFLNQISPGDVAMLFYAGHGVEISGENFLLPVDIPDASPGQEGFVKNESVSLNDILLRLKEKKARLNVVVLDACRDNPFQTASGRSLGSKRGLAGVAAPRGTFVMYSADAGEEALDALHTTDNNPNSVFTRSLLPLMRKPGADLIEIAREVRVTVRNMALTVSHSQTPAYYDAVLGSFYFSGRENAAPEQTTNAPRPTDAIARDFEVARQLNTRSAWRAFLNAHGEHQDNFRVQIAKGEFEALSKPTEPVTKSPQLTRSNLKKLANFNVDAKAGYYQERVLTKDNSEGWTFLKGSLRTVIPRPNEKWGAAISVGLKEQEEGNSIGKLYLRISTYRDNNKKSTLRVDVFEGPKDNQKRDSTKVLEDLDIGEVVDFTLDWSIPGVVTVSANGQQRKRIKIPWRVRHVSLIANGGKHEYRNLAVGNN